MSVESFSADATARTLSAKHKEPEFSVAEDVLDVTDATQSRDFNSEVIAQAVTQCSGRCSLPCAFASRKFPKPAHECAGAAAHREHPSPPLEPRRRCGDGLGWPASTLDRKALDVTPT